MVKLSKTAKETYFEQNRTMEADIRNRNYVAGHHAWVSAVNSTDLALFSLSALQSPCQNPSSRQHREKTPVSALHD